MKGTAALAVLLLPLACAGCITIGGEDEGTERRSYDLAAPLPEGRPVPADGPEVLSVEPFTVDAALDREELLWRRGAVESGAWESFRWVRPPEQGVREVLAAALARS
ncbi:MAG: membrane integrity-associated transporter subunit PqiC, partial [Planctomycetaceae bacterium]|nr:membrane integrity-associated transporter subunit PqiC [Planctomycetaceae bacterium]